MAAFEGPAAAAVIVPDFGPGAMDAVHALHHSSCQQQHPAHPDLFRPPRHGSSVGSMDTATWNHPNHSPPQYMPPLRSYSYAAHSEAHSHPLSHLRQANPGVHSVPPPGPPPPPRIPHGIYEEPSPPYTVSSSYSTVDQIDRGQPPAKRQRVEAAGTTCQATAVGTALESPSTFSLHETAELRTDLGAATRAAGVKTHFGMSRGKLSVPVAVATTAPIPAAVTRTAVKPKRVRTGCLTCRERHLKCDEATPDCLNCRKSNRVCKRGVRLNFIDVQVRNPPYMLPASEGWAVRFQDESRLIASEYQGGLGRYATFDAKALTPPQEADLDVVLCGHRKRHQQQQEEQQQPQEQQELPQVSGPLERQPPLRQLSKDQRAFQQPQTRYRSDSHSGGFPALFHGDNLSCETGMARARQGVASDTPPGSGPLCGPLREPVSLQTTAELGGLDDLCEMRPCESCSPSGRAGGASGPVFRSDLMPPVPASASPSPASWKELGLGSGTDENGRGGKEGDLPSDVSSVASSWVPEVAGPTAHYNARREGLAPPSFQLLQPDPAVALGVLHLYLPPNSRHAQEQPTPPQVETPDGLAVTPLSERSTASNDREREYLSSNDEMRYMQAFVQEVALWMDSFDEEQHFGRLVPFMALRSPMLLNASLACGMKHLTLLEDAQRGSGNLDGASCRAACQNGCIHPPQPDVAPSLASSTTPTQTFAPVVDEEDRDKALYYYDTATTQLMLALKNPDRSMAETATAAVVLNVYEIMSDTATARMNHLAGARALIRECGWTARSTGIGAACFWLNIRMEVLRCLAFGWKTAWDPDQWGLDPEFTTWGMEGGASWDRSRGAKRRHKRQGSLGSGSCSRDASRGEKRHDEALYEDGERVNSHMGGHTFRSYRTIGGGGGGRKSNGSELGGLRGSGFEGEESAAGSSRSSGSEGVIVGGEREDVWVHRIFYIVAKITNFRASIPSFREPSPHKEQARLQSRFGEWRRLKGMCDAWNSHCPRPMRPFGYCHNSSGGDSRGGHPGAMQPPTAAAAIAAMIGSRLSASSSFSLSPPPPSFSSPLGQKKTQCDTAASGRQQQKPRASVFPNVWLISRTAMIARLLYHTAMCLLAQVNPLNPRDSDESRAAQLHHARQVCGIVAHNADRGVASVALSGMAIAAAVLHDRGEQGEVLGVLGRIARDTGWRVGKVVAELKRAWGWAGAGGGGGGGNGGGGDGGRALVSVLLGPVSQLYGGEDGAKAEGVRVGLDGGGPACPSAGWKPSSSPVATQAPCSGAPQHQSAPGPSSSVGDVIARPDLASIGSIAPPSLSAPAPTRPLVHPLLLQADFSLPSHPYQNFYEPPNRTGVLGSQACWSG